MVLTRGHGQLMFMGTVSVEEGKCHWPLSLPLIYCITIWFIDWLSSNLLSGLHDLTSPDLSIAAEW
jgi:hypothetical protein